MIKKMTKRSRRMIRRRRWGGAIAEEERSESEEPVPTKVSASLKEEPVELNSENVKTISEINISMLDNDNINELYDTHKSGFIRVFGRFANIQPRTEEQNLKLLFLMKRHLSHFPEITGEEDVSFSEELKQKLQEEFDTSKKKLVNITKEVKYEILEVIKQTRLLLEGNPVSLGTNPSPSQKNDYILEMIKNIIQKINSEVPNKSSE